ncbi:hypothetical protein AWV79_11565 [Cupriavidus sp. UYMMa02A]|nr:hypothetical protein AWV79_11565 [Cupriavidus sp. UYMMa02A]
MVHAGRAETAGARSLLSENSSTVVNTGRSTGTNIICAMRSPGWITIGSVPGALRFHTLTMIWPW